MSSNAELTGGGAPTPEAKRGDCPPSLLNDGLCNNDDRRKKMQVIKLEVTVIDFDGLGADGVKDTIENARYPNHCISPTVRSVEVRDIGAWSDDHPLNKLSTADAELNRLFGA